MHTGTPGSSRRAEVVVAHFRAMRAEAYAEIVGEADPLLAHVARETEHRDFTDAELEEREADLSKLKR